MSCTDVLSVQNFLLPDSFFTEENSKDIESPWVLWNSESFEDKKLVATPAQKHLQFSNFKKGRFSESKF